MGPPGPPREGGGGWVTAGVSHSRALQEAALKAAAFYTLGGGAILHFAAPLLLQFALQTVERDAVGGGEAAANRIPIYRFTGNL